MPKTLKTVYQEVRKLKFEDRPDYRSIKNVLINELNSKLSVKNQNSSDELKHLQYNSVIIEQSIHSNNDLFSSEIVVNRILLEQPPIANNHSVNIAQSVNNTLEEFDVSGGVDEDCGANEVLIKTLNENDLQQMYSGGGTE